jgi:hypothetical protein
VNPLALSGKNITVRVNEDLSLTVLQGDGRLLWETSKTHTPVIVGRRSEVEPSRLVLARAAVSVSAFEDRRYRGYTVRLSGFEGVDVVLELIFAMDTAVDELPCSRTGPVLVHSRLRLFFLHGLVE